VVEYPQRGWGSNIFGSMPFSDRKSGAGVSTSGKRQKEKGGGADEHFAFEWGGGGGGLRKKEKLEGRYREAPG